MILFLGAAVLMLSLSLLSRGGLAKTLFSWSLFMVGFSLLCAWASWKQILLYQIGCLLLAFFHVLRKKGKNTSRPG